jgi:photosystem II stability/assembly factor-like uncharacterized protein
MKWTIYFACLLLCGKTFTQSLPALSFIQNNTESSFRGIAVSPNGTVWISGSQGTIGWSDDQATSWHFKQVPGFETAEFRDIELLSDSTVVLMSSTEPAAILISTDAGKHFSTAFYSRDSTAFLDGMDFLDGNLGICYGDPVAGRMLVLKTINGGKDWIATSNGPVVSDGTAAFAASGSGIWYMQKDKILLLTGGYSSDIFQSVDGGMNWQLLAHLPFESGPTAGAYSLWFTDSLHGYVVGGDYTQADSISNNCFYTADGGLNWLPAAKMPSGYRSVIVADHEYVVVAGINGIDAANMQEMKFEVNYPFEYNTAIIHQNMLYLAGPKGFTGSIQLR